MTTDIPLNNVNRVHLPTQGDVQEGGAQAEAIYPFYVVPTTAAYHTPQFMQSVQAYRDRFGIRTLFLEFLASFFFTFMLMMPRAGIFLQTVATVSPLGLVFTDVVVTLFCLFFAVMFAVYIAAPHSGAFIMPNATLCYAIFRGFPWKYVPFYFVAQWLGAFIAGVFVYAFAAPILADLDGGSRGNVQGFSHVFVNQPSTTYGIGHLFFAELLGGAIFFFIVFGLTDIRNPLVNPQWAPFLIGAAVFMVYGTFGWYGFVLHPFRDFAVRVYMSHYYSHSTIWTYHNHYSMVALFTPFLAFLVGAAIYDLFVNQRYVPALNSSLRMDLSQAQLANKGHGVPGTLNHPTPTHTGTLPATQNTVV